MSLIKVYGAAICKDCLAFLELKETHKLDWEYIDITESTANLKEFLALRDTEEAFTEVREYSRIGIPAYTLGNLVTLDFEEALSWDARTAAFPEIYLASGCFWGAEKALKQLKGVVLTDVGYANSLYENPSYQMVCTGATMAAETVRVKYNPEVVSLEKILEAYFMIINPTELNQQGPDIGTQYRTGVYYTNPADADIVTEYFEREARKHQSFFVEEGPLKNYYRAEDYHQNYLDVNPTGYCHVRLETFARIKELN